jgi:alpha-N-arabinofuranosidase
MFFQWTVFLLAIAAFSGLASAGPKLPRSREILPRKVTNTSSAVSLSILTNTGTRNATAPNLYGWMFEDINHSGDGGLYGELLANRAFDGSDIGWGTVPNFLGSSIVYQENSCEAFGKLTSSGQVYIG